MARGPPAAGGGSRGRRWGRVARGTAEAGDRSEHRQRAGGCGLGGRGRRPVTQEVPLTRRVRPSARWKLWQTPESHTCMLMCTGPAGEVVA